MEIAPPMDYFNFNSSSPFSGDHYISAPSSPTRQTHMYCDFDELLISAAGNHRTTSISAVPFAWEEKPGVPKTFTIINSFEDDEFSFDLTSHNFGSDSVLIPAEDLFHGGVIKTVDPDPDPEREINRGRERSVSRLPTSSRSRRTRSLSPLGSSDYRRQQQQQPIATCTKPNPSTNSISSSSTPAANCENGSRRWSFRDLFLFRSASDGRAMDKDPLKKYSSTNLFTKQDQDLRNNSNKSGSVSKRRGQVSAHEQHYNMNRALSNDMKKKTYLPYKQGILGGLPFNV